MPDVTRLDVDAGFIGLTVVFARKNDTTPKTALHKPSKAKNTAKWRLAENVYVNPDSTHAHSHMSKAVMTVTAGGGIFSSKLRMTTMLIFS